MWTQHWKDLLFLHWRIDADELQSRVPAPLEIDTYDGEAWISVVLFRLHVRLKWFPSLPGFSNLVEANLRTYVRHHDDTGIWFLSVHADNRWAIRVARLLTPIPYEYAALDYQQHGNEYRFTARHETPQLSDSDFAFRPTGIGNESSEGSLDEWLLERYRLFTPGRGSPLAYVSVVHPRWVTQHVDLSVCANYFGRSLGLDLMYPPDRVLFSRGVKASFNPFERIATKGSRPGLTAVAPSGLDSIEPWKATP